MCLSQEARAEDLWGHRGHREPALGAGPVSGPSLGPLLLLCVEGSQVYGKGSVCYPLCVPMLELCVCGVHSNMCVSVCVFMLLFLCRILQ